MTDPEENVCLSCREESNSNKYKKFFQQNHIAFIETTKCKICSYYDHHFPSINLDVVAQYSKKGLEVPPHQGDNGIIICAGGRQYAFDCWVLLNLIRKQGIALKIQIWHYKGEWADEVKDEWIAEFPLVEFHQLEDYYSGPIYSKFVIKPLSLLYTNQCKSILIDADNNVLANIEHLFHQLGEESAIFWPDFETIDSKWSFGDKLGVNLINYQEFETGQIVINRFKSWNALLWTALFNIRADVFYPMLPGNQYGDKNSFLVGWKKAKIDYRLAPLMSVVGSYQMGQKLASNICLRYGLKGSPENCYQGVALLHHNLTNEPMFLHTTVVDWWDRFQWEGLKDELWKIKKAIVGGKFARIRPSINNLVLQFDLVGDVQETAVPEIREVEISCCTIIEKLLLTNWFFLMSNIPQKTN